jgi:HK97 family phage major capsid protein
MLKKSTLAMNALAASALLGFNLSPAERRMGRLMRDPNNHPDNREPVKSTDDLVKDIKGQLEKSTNDVKAIAEKAVAEAGKGIEMAEGVKEQADELLVKMNGLADQFRELEQRTVAGGSKGEPEKSIGAKFAESESLKSLIENGGRGKADLEIKAVISSATTDAAGSAGAAVNQTRLPGVVPLARRRMFIQDLIAPGQMTGNTIEWIAEKARNLNAAPVAEGAAKPQSDIQLELKSMSARVIAAHMKASRQIMDDFDQLRTFIDNILLYDLDYKLENQIINGDGTGQNLSGLIVNSTAYAVPAGSTAATTLIDKLRVAMLQATLAEYPASAHILHPTDWSNIEREKDLEGRYMIGVPQGTAAPMLWGIPVVASQFMAQDKFLTGAFDIAAQYFDRWLARVQIATENEDDFIKNMVTILAECRGVLAVYRPAAIIYGDLGQTA